MPEDKASAVDRTSDAIRRSIQEGRFVPGQRLVIADLMELFGVSAGPVREAIRRLTGEGLVQFVPNRGATVRTLSVDELVDVFRIRETIEGLAARIAAENIERPGNRDRLCEEIDAGGDAMARGAPSYIDHNRRLHALIYDIADNPRLTEIATQLTASIYRLRYHALMDTTSMRQSSDDHDEIVEAIIAGDGNAAELAMRRHIEKSGRNLRAAVLDGPATGRYEAKAQ